MLKKLINTFKYGNRKTKQKLYLMIGILSAGVLLAVVACVLGSVLLGILAFGLIFINGLILLNTSFEQRTVTAEHAKQRKKGGKKQTDEEEPGALEWLSSEKKEEEKDENPFIRYDETKLKKILVKYKVKKHHVPVMIDLCQTEKIIQSPAYMWKDSVYLYFLVLGEEPRLLKSALSDTDAIHIRRGVTARPMEEYGELNEPSLVSKIFGSLLPKYYTVESGPYRTEYKKNRYLAAPGIWCTSASVKNMLKLLPANFVLDDGKTDGESVYYQEIYIARVMFYDGIYTAGEYKEKVLEVLGELIRAQISELTVRQYVDAMVIKGLIPQEYAEYVFSKRKVK